MTVTIPTTIVIDGSGIPVTASSTSLTGSSDKVIALLYKDGDRSTTAQAGGTIALNKQQTLQPFVLRPGTFVAHAGAATTYCSVYSSDICSYDSDFRPYTFVTGLTYVDSASAIAKYASKVSLSATNDGTATTWTATVQQYSPTSWIAWAGAPLSIGGTTVTTDAKGVATWVEPTSDLHALVASVPETDTVWSSESASATPTRVSAPMPVTTAPVPSKPVTASKPGHVNASATASKAASALKKGIPTVRKVVKLTKKNDVNKLLGKSDGYTSAAVLYDRRLSCSGGPGVDCGATIEKFTTTAKAKARAKHIQTLLKRYSFLGTEYENVHGRFLLRVSGDLTHSQAVKYKSAFAKSFK